MAAADMTTPRKAAAATPKPKRRRVRLLHIDVQITSVIDDGSVLIEQTAKAQRIPAHEWDQWVTKGMPAAIAAAEKRLNAKTPARRTEPEATP